jgi:hypothetical protein
MFLGMFGLIFLPSQFLQNVAGCSFVYRGGPAHAPLDR